MPGLSPGPISWAGGTSESDPRPGRRTRRAGDRRQLPHRPGPHPPGAATRKCLREDLPLGDHRDVQRLGRRRHPYRPRRRHRAQRHPQRPRARRLRLRRVDRHRAERAWPSATSSWSTPTAGTRTPARACTASSTPSTTRCTCYSQFETADAKRMFACFDQPDLKATFDITVTAPAALAGDLQRRQRTRSVRGDAHVHTFVTTPQMSTYLVGADRRAVRPLGRRLHRRPRRHPAGPLLPRVAGGVHGRRAAVHRDQAGFRLLPPQLRRAVRIRQVRPAVRAGVQRRRDGERRRGDVPGGLRLPVQGHPVLLRAARRDRAARDGAHVVRRPRHHGSGGTTCGSTSRFATFASVLCQAEATEYTQAWTTFANVEKSWAYRQDQLPSTHPVAADIPDLHAGRGELRRHHLRQGRQRAQAAGRLRRAGSSSWPGCATTSATTRSATRRSAICSARWRSRRAATCPGGGQQWLKTTGLNTLRPDFDVDADGAFTRFALTQCGAAAGRR